VLTLTETEGLPSHGESVTLRTEDSDPDDL